MMMMIFITLLSCLLAATGTPICTEPPKDELDKLVENRYKVDIKDITKVEIPAIYNDTQKFLLYGDFKCPATTKPDYCPFYYILNTDYNRKPSTFFEKRCSCNSPPPNVYGTSPADCKAIFRDEPVYRKTGCLNGVYIYTLTLESFQIGCERDLEIRILGSDTPKSPA